MPCPLVSCALTTSLRPNANRREKIKDTLALTLAVILPDLDRACRNSQVRCPEECIDYRVSYALKNNFLEEIQHAGVYTSVRIDVSNYNLGLL